MKLYLNSNITEGTPEELVTYQELLKDRGLESEKSLFSFGHVHASTVHEADLEVFSNSGEFYKVNVENSALAKGTVLKKVDDHTHEDSLGHEYLGVGNHVLEPTKLDKDYMEDRFNFAKQIGVRLEDSTDFSYVAEGKYFKSVGGLVTIAKDDRDNQPQCKDKHGNFHYVFFSELELAEDTEEAEDVVVEDSMHDVGAFYTVTEEAGDSPLAVGTVLLHQYGNLFIDSIGHRCRISRPSFVDRGSTHSFDDSIKQGRFELAKELGIKLTSTTDFAVEASSRIFKFKEDDGVFSKGESVKIVRDDNDRLPLVQSVKDSYKEDFAYIGKLKLVQDTFKGFFGSLMIDKSSIESTESSTDEEQTPSTELKVGDRVKVLKSMFGAVGEATVTAVLGGGGVKIAGTSSDGKYLDDWSNNVANLEKLEEESPSIEKVIEDLLLYEFYEVVDPEYFASSVKKGTILKRTSNTYTQFDDNYIKLTTSTGLEQKGRVKDNIIKPVTDDSYTKDRFEFAKQTGVMLKVDTDFAVECIGHQFRVTDKECLSNFEEYDVLTIRSDDGSNAISFRGAYGDVQFTLLEDVREIARPNHYK